VSQTQVPNRLLLVAAGGAPGPVSVIISPQF
jgi:hypothetical protein